MASPPAPDPRPRPLRGLRIIDCSRVLSGPICGRMLADLGAEVVKVEAPEADILRATPPHVGGFGSMYSQYNVGKRNISLDLKAEGAAGIVAELADRADVFLENFRPGVLDRLGLAPAKLRARNPRLIVCSITGWGQRGPWSDRPAYAPIVQAEAGTLALGGRLREGPMLGDFMQHADLYAGMMACQAILAALFHRERTGEGQHLDIAMGEALLYVNEHATAEIAGHDGSNGFPTWQFETFTLGDGRSVHLMGRPEQLFPALAHTLPMSDALADPRFSTPEARSENLSALVECLREALRGVADQKTLEALLAGTPLIVVGVRTTEELARSEWATERQALTRLGPDFAVPTAPWRADGLAIGLQQARVARRGEDNEAVLGDWLGLDAARCRALEEAGILDHADIEPPSLDAQPRTAFRRAPADATTKARPVERRSKTRGETP